MSSATAFSSDYPKGLKKEWKKATTYVEQHRSEWQAEFDLFGIDEDMAIAIIFPELLRYSQWQDQLETSVNALYVSQGRSGADFSIGQFQMKPSFAEQVDADWNASALAIDYNFYFDIRDNADARRARLSRIGTIQGQCRYLSLFILLQMAKHPQLASLPKEEQVRLLATAYNTNYASTYDRLKQRSHERRFHTDLIPTRFTRYYGYSDLAVEAYRHLKK